VLKKRGKEQNKQSETESIFAKMDLATFAQS
jgi:hypothetical protein